MIDDKDTIKGLVGAALCDFLAYMKDIRDPIITGGQYKNTKLIEHFITWTKDRNFSIDKAEEAASTWIKMCSEGMFKGEMPEAESEPEPEVEPEVEPEEEPEEGFFNENTWREIKGPKKPWYEENEERKDGGFDDDDLQPT